MQRIIFPILHEKFKKLGYELPKLQKSNIRKLNRM